MKKNLVICLFAALALTACGSNEAPTSSTGGGTTTTPTSTTATSTDPVVTTLAAPTNLAFDGTNLTFSAVENAVDYVVKVKQGIEEVYSENIVTTSINLKAVGLYGGHYTAEVIARNGGITSDPASLAIELIHVDTNQKLEAELGILDRTRNWSNDEKASGGAYALNFNDCGQGLYFRYYAFAAGNRDITFAYATATPNSFMTLFVNDTAHNYKITFTENTGWFGDNGGVTAQVTVQNIAFLTGWNELYLIKNGTGSDDPAYGGNAQLDYIVIKGTNAEYDLDEFDMASNSYNFEAEMAHWHWANASQRPNNWASYSLHFGLGAMDGTNDGVKYDSIYIAEAGTYAIRPVLGGNKSLKVFVDDGDEVVKNFGTYSEYDSLITASDDIYRVELTAGFHTIEFVRNGSWFTIDKLILTKIVS